MAQQLTRGEDAQLLDFVRAKADTFVKWDLLRFFHDNPYAADTAANIARFAGRDAHKVDAELKQLADQGVLAVKIVGDTRVYSFVKDEDVRALIGRFVLACDDPDFRVRAINLIIEGLQ